MADIPDYHTTPVQAAESANEAGVPLLLLYHLNPPPPNPIAARVFLRGVSAIRKDGVLMARDGMLIELPLAGGPAKVSQRSEEHTSELQSLMRISYAVFC